MILICVQRDEALGGRLPSAPIGLFAIFNVFSCKYETSLLRAHTLPPVNVTKPILVLPSLGDYPGHHASGLPWRPASRRSIHNLLRRPQKSLSFRMNAFADVTAQLPGVLTSDGADLNTAEFLLACRCIIPIIGAPTPVDILRLRSPRPARTSAREMTQMSTPTRLASRRHPLACRAGKAYSGGLGFFTLTATQRHGLHVECKCRQPCARLRRGSCRHTNRPSVMPTLTRGAHAEKLGTAFYPAKTDVSGNIEVGSFQRRGPSQFEARS